MRTKVNFKNLDLSCHMTLMCYEQRYGPVIFHPLRGGGSESYGYGSTYRSNQIQNVKA